MGNEPNRSAPVTRRVRAFFAPVDRTSGQPTLFDPGQIAAFNADAPAAPWLDLGWCKGFSRKSGTKIGPLIAGAPGIVTGQVRTEIDAQVAVEFESWGKLQMALTAGVQQMNVLALQNGAAANGSGGAAAGAVPLAAGAGAGTLSAATSAAALDVGFSAAAGFSVGDVIAVDVDLTGQTGFVGSGVSGGFIKTLASIGSDVDYVRRITLNVARITANTAGVLELGGPLFAGVPSPAMKVSKVIGFCDREGGSFFQEWSALFLADGEQGDRIAFHYPRLQSMAGIAEKAEGLAGVQAGTLERLRLQGNFRALPVKDANDGESIVCFRSYLPAALRAV